VKHVIAGVHLASPVDPIRAAGAMKKRAAIRINAKRRKLEENERRVGRSLCIAESESRRAFFNVLRFIARSMLAKRSSTPFRIHGFARNVH